MDDDDSQPSSTGGRRRGLKRAGNVDDEMDDSQPATEAGDVEDDEEEADDTRPFKRRRSASSSSTLSSPDSDELPLQQILASTASSNANIARGGGSGSRGNKGVPIRGAEKQPILTHSHKGMAVARTVPDHQPGTPHADLHNPGTPAEAAGPGARPLDDKELQEAIDHIQVKQEEEGLDEAGFPPSSAPTQPAVAISRGGVQKQQRAVEQMVKGPALDEESEVTQPKPRERPAQLEERLGIIRFVPVTSSIPSIITSIILTGLKNIFQRQLPKMPREYITRLVFDRNHWSVAIVKKGLQVVGGITYRPFERREFGEIVFCAITGTEQVRGYGSHLMNHVKDWVHKAHPGVKHFLTYADNYAFGYFKKQGFTKEVTLPRSYWAGYIKDYEGATIMQCTMLPRIEYLQAGHMLLRQKMLILQKIRENSNTHVVHSGRDLFGDRKRVDPSEVKALCAIGWKPEIDAQTRRPERGPHHAIMRRLLTDLQNHPASWAFARPVNGDEVPDYYESIKNPMDLETMENKLNANRYYIAPPEDGTLSAREGIQLFLQDTDLIFYNCELFNSASSNYVRNAHKLKAFLAERVVAYTTDS